eukprot:jgi/Mesen1/452/ME000101S10680
MAGGHGDGHGVTYGGLTLHAPKRWHKVVGTGMDGGIHGMAMAMGTGMMPATAVHTNTRLDTRLPLETPDVI